MTRPTLQQNGMITTLLAKDDVVSITTADYTYDDNGCRFKWRNQEYFVDQGDYVAVWVAPHTYRVVMLAEVAATLGITYKRKARQRRK